MPVSSQAVADVSAEATAGALPGSRLRRDVGGAACGGAGERHIGEGEVRAALRFAEVVVAELEREIRRELVAAENLPGCVVVLAARAAPFRLRAARVLELRLAEREAGIEALLLRERAWRYCCADYRT